MKSNYESYPWHVTTPVRRGNFRAVYSEHQECNVSVAGAAIETYGTSAVLTSQEKLLFSDLQSHPYCYVPGRLGSGRSGVYRGWYLKGIGRTPLASNWNSEDYLHNTGHMAASSAIREYVVTCWLRAVGFEKSIVPCVGILLAPLSPKLSGFIELTYRNATSDSIPLVDRYIQAISVKQANFARASNFIWLLQHLVPNGLGRKTNLATFARLLASALAPERHFQPADIDPDTLIRLLEEAIHRGLNNFRSWFRAGVWWGSFSNNFTIDGRFLDLETPAIAGGPFFGVLKSEKDSNFTRKERITPLIGTEFLRYILQMRLFLRQVGRLLVDLPPSFSRTERRFAAELVRGIEMLSRDDSALASKSASVDLGMDIITGDSDKLSPSALASLRTILSYEYDERIDSDCKRSRGPEFQREFGLVEDLPSIIVDAGTRMRFNALILTPDEFICPSSSNRAAASSLSKIIADLDNTTEIPVLAGKIREVPRLIDELVRGGR